MHSGICVTGPNSTYYGIGKWGVCGAIGDDKIGIMTIVSSPYKYKPIQVLFVM